MPTDVLAYSNPIETLRTMESTYLPADIVQLWWPQPAAQPAVVAMLV